MATSSSSGEESLSFEYTPTWRVAIVCFVIVLISLAAERGLHKLGKCFKRKKQDALFDSLQKVQGELMLLGFISLLLTGFQDLVSRICISQDLGSAMLPCKMENSTASASHYYLGITTNHGRRYLAGNSNTSEYCSRKGKVPFLSTEALHQLHIFIFVMAIVHVVYCATTMLLGLAKIKQWSYWEHSIRNAASRTQSPHRHQAAIHNVHLEQFKERAGRYWRKKKVVSWTVAFFKQFYGSVSKADYIALRSGFIRAHIPRQPDFDFHEYMLRTLENDFKKVVSISWYLWLFVVLFLLMNIQGWHTYFWMSFLPLALLILVGAKLEHIISVLAKDVAERETGDPEAAPVRPSDELFWFHRPAIVLNLLHFIMFQNAFEIAFFFWIWVTYGFRSCMMDKLGFIITRLLIGLIVQVLCSYSTLPLYALVTQMGSMFKEAIFDEHIRQTLLAWADSASNKRGSADRLATESLRSIPVSDQPTAFDEIAASMVELPDLNKCRASHS